jgi:hypothetical protein
MPSPTLEQRHQWLDPPDDDPAPRKSLVHSAREAIRNACYDNDSVITVVTNRVIEQLS